VSLTSSPTFLTFIIITIILSQANPLFSLSIYAPTKGFLIWCGLSWNSLCPSYTHGLLSPALDSLMKERFSLAIIYKIVTNYSSRDLSLTMLWDRHSLYHISTNSLIFPSSTNQHLTCYIVTGFFSISFY
jgi:hypothetical protein